MTLKRATLLILAVCALYACNGDRQSASDVDWQTELISDDEESFLLGNIAFLLFHEQGHALVSELDLPVLGREEDAADRMATIFLAENDDPEDIEFLVQAMAGWFLSADRDGMDDIAWWGEHGSDQQRGYQIACLLYGSDPEKFESVAEDIDLPEERRETCTEEYQATSDDFAELLEPHILKSGEQQKHAVTVTYDDPGDHLMEKKLLEESQLMEWVADDLRESIRLKRPITVNAANCDEANAFWDPETAELTICYELIREFRELYHEEAR